MSRVVVVFDKSGVQKGREQDASSRLEIPVLAKRIVAALRRSGFEALLLPVSVDVAKKVGNARADVVFNLCESFDGDSALEGGVAAQFDLAGIAFTGSSSFCLSICQNKALSKRILRDAGILTPNFEVVEDVSKKHCSSLAFPLIIKPLHEDASEGITKESVVFDRSSLDERVTFVLEGYQQPALVEEYIEGREINCALLGSFDEVVVLPLSEIVFEQDLSSPKIVDFESKWDEHSLRYQKTSGVCPADLSDEMTEKISQIAKKAYGLLGLTGYGRIDFRLRGDQVFVLEANPNPGINIDSGFVRSAKAAGMSFSDVIEAIVVDAKKRFGLVEKEPVNLELCSSRRIRLCRVGFDQIDTLVRWFNDGAVSKYMDAPFETVDFDSLVHSFFFQAQEGVDFVAFEQSSDVLFGYASLYNVDLRHGRAEISYLIGEKDFFGRGLGKELVGLVVGYAFSNFGLQCLLARVLPENKASIGCLKSNGFVEVGRSVKSHFDGKNFVDELLFEKSR